MSSDGAESRADGAVHLEEIREAIAAVRREGKKAVFVEAGIEAALVLLAVNLALSAVEVDAVPDAIALPPPVADAVGLAALPTPAVVAVVLAALAFVVEVTVRTRGPLVERYERANPVVAEALRTARDAAADDERTTMAGRLYDDVLATLRETTSDDLVNVRRIAAVVLLLVAFAFGSIQVAIVGVEVDLDETLRGDGGRAQPADGGGAGGEASGAGQARSAGATGNATPYTGLQDPESVLGEPTDVTAGTENLTAMLAEGGAGTDGSSEPRSFERSGFAGSEVDVEAQQSGFLAEEGIEDADIIREYNLRIRGAGGDGGNATAVGGRLGGSASQP